MKYSIGTNLADFGFAFFEKIHEPIFLVNRLGKIAKMNGAGRKLLSIAKINMLELDRFISEQIAIGLLGAGRERCVRLKVGNRGLRLIARSLCDSDFVLVEIKR